MNHAEGNRAPLALANPFVGPFAPAGVPAARFESAIDAPPRAVDPSEIESDDASLEAIFVKVTWAGDVVRVAHVTAGGAFTIGDAGCDFALPAETVGAARLPLVSGKNGALRVIVPAGALAVVRGEDGRERDIAELVADGVAVPSREHAGAHVLSMAQGTRAEIALANVSFELVAARAPKRAAASIRSLVKPEDHAYTGMSALLHGALVLSLAFFLPAMKGNDGETIDRDQIDAMRPYLASIAEREREESTEPSNDDAKTAPGGGTGTAAKDESGGMGSAVAPARDARYAVKGSADNADPRIARERALLEAETFGLVGILMGSTENAPVARWAAPDAFGRDDKSALGHMWGATIDDAAGVGGLGLSGAGLGAGGLGEGIGLGSIGGLGHGLGDGDGPGIGNGPGGIGHGHGALPSTYVPKGVSLRVGVTEQIGGQIPAEVIQRIVRQNFGRFRLCYENGLRTNPGMSGRVAVKFVIDRQGAVSLASDGGSDLPDQGVISCVVRGFQNLSFPEPKGGMVKVTYPLVFSPGE